MNNDNNEKPELRVRTTETDAEIAEEVMRCANAGRIVCYFNSQAALDDWRLRVAALYV